MKIVRVLLVLVFALTSNFATAVEFTARPVGFVNDLASMMTAEEVSTLNATLEKFRDASKVSIVVATITSASDYGYPSGLIDLGVGLFEKWKPGTAGHDSGVLIIVAGKAPPYKIRIVTGRGVEGAIPDVIAKRIIEDTMKPVMHKGTPGAYAQGLTAGIESLMKRTQYEFVPKVADKKSKPEVSNVAFVIALIIIGVAFVLTMIIGAVLLVAEHRKAVRERAWQSEQEAERLRVIREMLYPRSRQPHASFNRNSTPKNKTTQRSDSRPARAIVAPTDDGPSTSRYSGSSSYSDSGSSSSYSSPDFGGSTSGGGGGDN